MSSDAGADRERIREIIEQWVIFSDSGDWERFAALWHEDGWMTATWLQAPAQEFVRARRAGFERGVSLLHFLGGFSCDIAGERAIAQTKMTINQRASVDGVLCDCGSERPQVEAFSRWLKDEFAALDWTILGALTQNTTAWKSPS